MRTKNILLATLLLMFSITPLVTFAKDNGKNDDDYKDRKEHSRHKEHDGNDHDKDNDKRLSKDWHNLDDDSSKLSCRIAYGHLFAFGWLKKDSIDDDTREYLRDNCQIPSGIFKRIREHKNNHSSTTPDTISPIISDIDTTIGTTTLTINWNTDENTSSRIYYSTTTPAIQTSSYITDVHRIKSHAITVNNLIEATKYYFVIKSKDKAGNTTLSNELTAMTL